MVGVSRLLTFKRIALSCAVLLAAVAVAGKLAAAASSEGPSASFTFGPTSPLSGEQTSFSSTSTDDGALMQFDWDFGDGTSGDGADVNHNYPIPGVYTVKLTVTDDESLQNTAQDTITVQNREPAAAFHWSPDSPQAGEAVMFTSDATDPENRIEALRWDLDNDGDFTDHTGSTASQAFPAGGPYTVSLRIVDKDGGSATISKTVDVIDPPNEQPIAGFNFSPSSPNILETVTFTSTSTDNDGSIVSRLWDLDNDGNYDDASGTQATKVFVLAGTYTVNLLVTDNEGATDTTTKNVTVSSLPNDPPTAAFHFAPSAPKTGDSVTFTSDATDDGNVALEEWDFENDGTYDTTGSEVQHSYSIPKAYTVKLRVTDNEGVQSETTKTVTASNRAPVADFSYAPTAPVKGQTINFSSLATDPENRVKSVTWDLNGDNQFTDAAGPTAQEVFNTPGNHTVRLKIEDLDGGSNTASKTIVIPSQPPTASFAIDPEQPLSLVRVTFTSTSTDPDGAIAEIRWDTDNDGQFDDGSDVEASRVFSNAGVKTVRLRVTDDDNNVVTTSRTLTVDNRAPTAKIDAPSAAPKNTSVPFTSISSDLDGSIAKTEWDLDNDGLFDDSTATAPTKSFTTTGPKTVRLRVTDNLGVTDEATHVVDIGGNSSPTAAFTISASNPLSLTNVTFTSTSSDTDGSISAIAWDLDGDGNYDDGSKTPITKQFPTPGPQIVRLRVTDNDGASDFVEKTVNVANRAPTAAVDMAPASPTSLEDVTFTAIAADPDGTVGTMVWDLDDDTRFDDGVGPTITHAFPTKGTYTVRVRVSDTFGAMTTGTRVVNVTNRLPLATFSHAPGSPNPREAITMTSTSTDLDGTISKIEWDTDNDGAFDDATGMTASRTFTTSGIKTVRLRVTDNDGGENIGSQTIVVGNRPPVASFDFRPGAPVAEQLVTFFSTSDDPDKNIETVEWDLDGDGSFETAGTSVGRTFPVGSFNVSVRVTDTEGSFSIATQTIVVSAPAPATQVPQISSTGPQLRLLNPFPIVRIAGRIGRRGARFRLLTVNAPAGATVTVRCKGRGCPFKASTRSATAARQVRIHKLEQRLLRSGTAIKIFVTKPGSIGKYTSIIVRGGKSPRRSDRCLMPDSNTKPVKCPS